GTDIDNGSSDVCGLASLTASPSTFDCSDIGTNNVTLTVTDNGGLTDACTAVVTVQDMVAPVAVCQNITVQLGSNGTVSITPVDVDGGSTDACGIATRTLDNSSFTCADKGTNTVTLTVIDNYGNQDDCQATVTVEDKMDPVINCPTNISTLATSNSGAVVTYSAPVGTDNCAGAVTTQTAGLASGSTFPIGTTTNTFLVTDASGNTATCSFTVMVNAVPPVINCPANIVVYNTNGQCGASVNFAATETTAIPPSVITYDINPGSFFSVGTTTVTATATNPVGSDDCSFTITVIDNEKPNAICQDLTVQLSSSGTASITAAQVNNGSTDNCQVNTTSIDISSFDCDNVGANTVTLTVTDLAGNSKTCTSTVTVQDMVSPVALCQTATVYLDNSGMAVVMPGDIDAGSGDACGIATLMVAPSSFDCSDLGPNAVFLFVTDNNGNQSFCSTTVTIADNTPPMLACQNHTVALDASGSATVVPADVYDANNSSDNCGTVNLLTVIPFTFDCADLGSNTVTLTANDGNGNSSTCTATVTVEDNIDPVITCPASITQANDPGVCAAIVNYTAATATDNCSAAITYSQASGTSFPVGATMVTATATDPSGNTHTCDFTVTVNDTEAPGGGGTTYPAPANILANVAEASGYDMVYQLDIPNVSNWDVQSQVPYAVNNAAALGAATYDRIAYYVELDNEWIWVSVPAFTADVSKTGIPTDWDFTGTLTDMNVFSNKAGIV
ncbi:MAG: HYR domain-containing protein, partial [Bacteroidetes bacterium]